MTELPVNYPKSITAKSLNSQSQVWEAMLSQHAMQLTPYKRAWRSSEQEEGEGRDFSGSLA